MLTQAPPNIKAERRAICRACPNYLEETSLLFGLINLDGERCGICGCFIIPKTALANQQCPLQNPKWKPVKAT